MGLFSSISSGLKKLGSTALNKVGGFIGSSGGQAILGAAGDILGGVANSALGYYNSKHMAGYNYDLQKRGYLEFPSAQVAGLRAAGINPMLAFNGIAGATSHNQGYSSIQPSNIGSNSMTRYQQAKQNELAEKNLTSQINVNSANAEKARKEGEAAIMNAESNRMSVNKMAPRDPSNSGWATGSYITDAVGSVGTAVGGTALATKGVYDMVKSPKSKIIKTKDHFGKPVTAVKYPGGLVVPTTVSQPVNSAKKVAPVLIGSGKLGAIGLVGAGSLYGAKKLMDTYDKSKNAKKIKDKSWKWSHGNWSR